MNKGIDHFQVLAATFPYRQDNLGRYSHGKTINAMFRALIFSETSSTVYQNQMKIVREGSHLSKT